MAFLVANAFPFHRQPRWTEEQAREVVLGGRYWSADAVGLWVDADGERVGIAVIDDLTDVAQDGNPVFDVRLAEDHPGRDLGVPVLRGLTDLVFSRWPAITRFEGQTRDGWPVHGAAPTSSVAYATLRRDWESGTITPVLWDDGW